MDVLNDDGQRKIVYVKNTCISILCAGTRGSPVYVVRMNNIDA